MRFMELVKYLPYLDTDECQAECFVYGLNLRTRDMVIMWRSSSVAEAFKCAHYVEEHLGLKMESRPFGPPQVGLVGNTPYHFSREGSLRPPPYSGRFTTNGLEARAPMKINTILQASSRSNESPWNY